MAKKKVRLVGSFLLFMLLCGPANVSSAAEIKGSGQLKSVESGERVFIDSKGFLVDRDTRIFDGQKEEILLYRLTFPTQVAFQFSYTAYGPVISRIQVIPQ